jgi:putative oxidoreductase
MATLPNPAITGIESLYAFFVRTSNHLQSVVLYAIRFIWGIQLMQAGVGKLLNIPLPVENAWLVAFTETFGGMFLAFGLLARLISIPLIINFIVAYLTTEQKALGELKSLNTDDFFSAAPFLFLFAAVITLAFGPGAYSLDYLLTRWRGKEWKGVGL